MSTFIKPLPHPALWHGQSTAHVTASPFAEHSSGFRALDRELPQGGWPPGSLTELLVRHLGIGELRFLAPTLRKLTQAGKHIVLLAPPHTPYAPAFEAMGIATEKLLVVHANKPVDRLWAIEQSLKSNQFGALITWLDEPARPELCWSTPSRQDTTRPESIRRLQLAATKTNGLVFVFRPWAAQQVASPAPLRMLLLPRRYPDLAVQIIKRRGPVMALPIDIAIPIPGSGLRQAPEQDAIVAPSPLTLNHAVDRLRHSTPLSGTVPPATSTNRPLLSH
jgi:protein ImuA